jgi:hypothetical protein
MTWGHLVLFRSGGGVGTEPEQQLAWGALGFALGHPPRGRAPLGGAPQPAGPGSDRGGTGSPIWPGLPLVGPGCVPGKPPALFRFKDHQGGEGVYAFGKTQSHLRYKCAPRSRPVRVVI